MKKNILLLINGFGIEKTDSYNVYSAEVMPNMDKLTQERPFVSIPNKYLDYKSAYRNFSMGIDDALTYSLIDNNIYNGELSDNKLLKYIVSQVSTFKSRLHIFCFWDSPRTIEHLSAYIKEITKGTLQRIFVHLVLCQKSINDYESIKRGLSTLNYELGSTVKIGVITGEKNLHELLLTKDYVKNIITEFGEKWKDLDKKVDVLMQTQTVPEDARTFSVTPTYKFEENDQVLLFNYTNIDMTLFRKELYEQKYRQINLDTVPFYSLFPVKAEKQLPFMYNYAVSANYTLNSLHAANVKCLIMDKKDNCSYINYYLTGLRNSVDDSLKYMPTDDNFIYDINKLLETIKTYDNELYIINYEIDSCRNYEELVQRLKAIDVVIGGLDQYIRENNMAMFICSLYGLEKMMYNQKQELLKINFSGRVPLVIDDADINLTQYNVLEGSLYDLCNTLLWNINRQYKVSGLIKRKSGLFSFLYKKPKGDKK